MEQTGLTLQINISLFHVLWGLTPCQICNYCLALNSLTVITTFLLDSYNTFLSEDAGPNTLVATVHAKDPDGDGVSYFIVEGNEDGNFELDSQKGKTTKCLLTNISVLNVSRCLKKVLSVLLSLIAWQS